MSGREWAIIVFRAASAVAIVVGLMFLSLMFWQGADSPLFSEMMRSSPVMVPVVIVLTVLTSYFKQRRNRMK